MMNEKNQLKEMEESDLTRTDDVKTDETRKGKFAPTVSDWLTYFYHPFLPMLKKIHVHREGVRHPHPHDVLVPEGYVAEVVAVDLNAPVQCCFDDAGNCYISESGHKIDSAPQIVRINLQSGERQVVYRVPNDEWDFSGALTGACWHQGYLYFVNTNKLCRLGPDGKVEDIVTGLPGLGDHQTNHPIVGPDGKIYFGQGCVTNSGVVGADDAGFEWLEKYPQVCDVPAQDITLAGRNYEYRNVLGSIREKLNTGAFVPFGTETYAGQVIKGNVKCSGSILRCNPDGSGLEVVAWGLRNPYGLAFTADGRLYATEHGMDERSQRYIVDDPDDFYEIHQGEWYGWPDFASGIRLDDPYWGEGGHGREPVLAEFPNPQPPKPFVSFQTHAAANGVDFSPGPQFGFSGDAFIACFGDLAPITTITKYSVPAGFKVVRVDMKTGQIHDFAVNRIQGPASLLPHEGFERPSHCTFGPDGALYVTDFGTINIAPETGGIRQVVGSGTLWRIRRTDGPQGELPAAPASVPIYTIHWLVIVSGIVASIFALAWLVRRAIRR
jgi:glucose/arabinose dehydrogenase